MKKITLIIFIKSFWNNRYYNEILLQKLEKYEINGKNLLWMKSYLWNTKQCIEYENNLNEQKKAASM